MIGKTILQYKIIEKLGEGGMGIVYLAEDTRLERQVAIKFLPGHIAANSDERKRFEIEAKAAAALNHPNIATIFNIEETGEEVFIVMEYITGQELKSHFKSSPLPLNEVLDLSIQIADGLNAAHEKNIVHRDIKSSNIMITEKGRIKIMDFGLAKFRGAQQITQLGTTVGTAAYMSPEQTRGDEVDQRTDIWSFGILLYEMLTGSVPFKGDYDQSIMYSIVNEEIQPLTAVRSGLPMEFERIANKALAKDPEQRYQNLVDLMVDLKNLQKGIALGTSKSSTTVSSAAVGHARQRSWIKPALITSVIAIIMMAIILFSGILGPSDPLTADADRKMIVVLPFENLGQAEDEYFTDGITEEITSRLASVRDLGVISRTSAAKYKKSNKTIREIGAELNVTHVLEGTVRWEKRQDGPSRIRVTPQLIRVSDDTHLWTDRYDRDLNDIFSVQSNIAQQIIRELDITLVGNEQAVLESKPTDNMDAYQFYLRGIEAENHTDDSEKDAHLAIGMFQGAVDLDPDFALAYAHLASNHSKLYFWGFDRTDKRLMKAKDALDRAMALNPQLPQAHMAEGFYYYHGFRDYEKALKSFAIAEKSIPNDAELLNALAYIWRRQGHFEDALRNQIRATQLDPKSLGSKLQLGWTFAHMRRYERCIELFESIIEQDPTFLSAYSFKAWCLYELGQIDSARSIMNTMPGKDVDDMLYWRALFDYISKRYDGALEKYKNLKTQVYKGSGFITSVELEIGLVMEELGDMDGARSYYVNALKTMQDESDKGVVEHEISSCLGRIYAKLGDKKQAEEYGQRAARIMTYEKDAVEGHFPHYWLAFIYADIDEKEKALAEMDIMLSRPSIFSVTNFIENPTFEDFQDMPEFRELVAKYQITNK